MRYFLKFSLKDDRNYVKSSFFFDISLPHVFSCRGDNVFLLPAIEVLFQPAGKFFFPGFNFHENYKVFDISDNVNFFFSKSPIAFQDFETSLS